MSWLLEESIVRKIESARMSDKVSAQSVQEFEARLGGPDGPSSDRILTIAGDTAEIAIEGVLTKQPDFFAFLFGGGNTSYAEIINALGVVASDPNVSNVILSIDSPGGAVAGLFETIEAINRLKETKPVNTVVTGTATSAAYALAAQGAKIEATNPSNVFGSIGIIMTQKQVEGVTSLTSTEAPKKGMDITTPEGKEAVQEHLDAMHELFAQAIADGRGTTVAAVNRDFGRGGVLLAAEAAKVGMIDCISCSAPKIVASSENIDFNEEKTAMTIDELKAKHGDIYQAVFNLGAKHEQERVEGHLACGKLSPAAMKIAVKAIEDGDDFTAKYHGVYAAQSMQSKEIITRGSEDGGETTDPTANADGSGVESGEEKDTLEEKILANMGISAK